MTATSEEWNRYYKKNKNNKIFVAESFVARTFLSKRPVALLRDYDFQNKKILDVGCGDGRHISFFQQLGFRVTGSEISTEKTDALRRQFQDCMFINSKSNALNLDDASFDYVAAINSIYYLENENACIEENIKELVRVLKPHGAALVSFVGEEHFILKENIKDHGNKIFTISNTGHQCDGDIILRPVFGRDDIHSIFKDIDNIGIYRTGEIKDTLQGKTRHLYYIVAYKE